MNCLRTICTNKILAEKQNFLIQHVQQYKEGEINCLEYIKKIINNLIGCYEYFHEQKID